MGEQERRIKVRLHCAAYKVSQLQCASGRFKRTTGAKLTGREEPRDLCIVEAGENTAKQFAVRLRQAQRCLP
jgi:hypothetical protein